MMTKEQELKFLEFCDNLHKFIIKNGWQGASYASVAMMFAVAKKLGIDAKPCIGECIQKNQELFDHSWLLIDEKIYDIAISMPLELESATGPVFASIDMKTKKEVDIEYGIKHKGLGKEALLPFNQNIYRYLRGCDALKLIELIIDLAKNSRIYITRKWMEQNLSNEYFALVDNRPYNCSK